VPNERLQQSENPLANFRIIRQQSALSDNKALKIVYICNDEKQKQLNLGGILVFLV
jgi:hypothetical protein